MEKVISILNDIEDKATAIVDHTSIEKKVLHKQLTKNMEKLDGKISAETKKKLDAIHTEMNQEAELAKGSLKNTFEENMSQLEEAYAGNHDAYVEAIFKKIISE